MTKERTFKPSRRYQQVEVNKLFALTRLFYTVKSFLCPVKTQLIETKGNQWNFHVTQGAFELKKEERKLKIVLMPFQETNRNHEKDFDLTRGDIKKMMCKYKSSVRTKIR